MQYELFNVKLVCDCVVRAEEWYMPDDTIKVEQQTWYTVEIVNPDSVNLRGLWEKMDTWCTEIFGQGAPHEIWGQGRGSAWDTNCRWLTNTRKFWFRNQEDQFMFMLRWEWARE